MEANPGYGLTDWTVEYNLPDGKTLPASVSIPHAWRQETDVRWEGPAIYRCAADLPEVAWLVFEGVSYQARVFVNDEFAGEHRGIWDAFVVDCRQWSGQTVEISVEVVKNGGDTFPVRDVLSGFLPYVFQTFGGIYKRVRLVSSIEEPKLEWYESAGKGWAAASLSALVEADEGHLPSSKAGVREGVCRIRANGTRLIVDGKPFFARGVLSWGWYPDLGHQNPDWKTIRKEIIAAKRLGINLIKFCLWLPPHEFLEEMDKEGLFAWIELPLWDPSPDSEKLQSMKGEIERIVLQYRQHSNVIFWTCGCELSDATSSEFRQELVEMVQLLTGCPMVKDNSGGAEMYGGDPREFGAFDDFHPYCDLPFYPEVLTSLAAHAKAPILLGEFNDYDCARDLARLNDEAPYWVSNDPALNDKGVRWQYDFPNVVKAAPKSLSSNAKWGIVDRSIAKANFVRERVEDAVLSHDAIAGYVVTGWVDTPISTSGFLDENFNAKGIHLPPAHVGLTAIYPISQRRPPWIHGGNRPGWQDFANRWVGPNQVRFGTRWSFDAERQVEWTILSLSGETLAQGSQPVRSEGGKTQFFEFDCEFEKPGEYELEIRSAGSNYKRQIEVFYAFNRTAFNDWRKLDRENLLVGFPDGDGPNILATQWDPSLLEAWKKGAHVVLFALDQFTLPMPFWRECIHESTESRTWLKYFEEDRWEQILPISTDRALDREKLEKELGSEGKVLLTRIDTRTYAEHPFAMEFDRGGAKFVVTTLRPFGGLGSCPFGIKNNPSGARMLFDLLESFRIS